AAGPAVEDLAVGEERHSRVERWREGRGRRTAPSGPGVVQVIDLHRVVRAASQAEAGEGHDAAVSESRGRGVPAAVHHALRLDEAARRRIEDRGSVLALERGIGGTA